MEASCSGRCAEGTRTIQTCARLQNAHFCKTHIPARRLPGRQLPLLRRSRTRAVIEEKGGAGLLDKPGLDLSGMPTPSADDQLGGGEREGGKITGGGDYRVLLLQSDKHTEQLVVKAITTAIPGTSQDHALNCYNTAEKLGQAMITSCIKEVAEFYNEQLLRQGVSSKIEPDTTTL
ncbi:g3907 [Coccomyxa viridis]|uniref:G3907 protein n=1 Tax=Coccomyxa viridis TaxID=1274662 RepID=A0ABP1FNY4_9CHLO